MCLVFKTSTNLSSSIAATTRFTASSAETKVRHLYIILRSHESAPEALWGPLLNLCVVPSGLQLVSPVTLTDVGEPPRTWRSRQRVCQVALQQSCDRWSEQGLNYSLKTSARAFPFSLWPVAEPTLRPSENHRGQCSRTQQHPVAGAFKHQREQSRRYGHRRPLDSDCSSCAQDNRRRYGSNKRCAGKRPPHMKSAQQGCIAYFPLCC